MSKQYTFPHWKVDYKDESAVSVFSPEELPLHRPIFFVLAEKGELNKPNFGNYTELKNIYGEATFDEYSKFYKHQTLFASRALGYQKVFMVRLADEDAATGGLVIECQVTTGVQVTQYQKDEFGGRVLDVDGDPVPLTTGDPATTVTEPGIKIVWVARALGADENPAGIQPSVTGQTTKYPIMVITGTSPGAWTNVCGAKLWFDHVDLDVNRVENIDALTYWFQAIQQPYGVDTPLPIRSFFNEASTEFTFKEGAIDTTVDRRMHFDDILVSDYKGAIPFNFNVYSANVGTIGNLIVALDGGSGGLEELTNGYMANIMTGLDMLGHHYDHVTVDTTGPTGATMMDEDIIHYMVGGTDGSTLTADYEDLVTTWLTGVTFPDIYDQARYPITHMYDSGFNLDTKKDMIDFFGLRPDVKCVMSTQDVSLEANTKAEDQSTGSALRTKMLLHPASTVYGTQVFRGTILQQAGYLANSTWKQIVPATLDCMIKKCIYQGAIYFKGKPKGLPKSDVSIFKEVNWFPNSDDHKQLSWDTGLNYMQYYDMTRYHYADVRSIYPLDTSVMSDDIMADILIYLHHIARFNWSVFAGRDENPNVLFGEIERTISKDIYSKFQSYVNATVTAYQTDLDKALGYQSTIEIAVYGNLPQRVWNIIIPVRREVTE